MRDVLRLYEPTGPRLDIAIDQLDSGLGFVFDGVWFRRDGSLLASEAVWESPELGLLLLRNIYLALQQSN